MAEPFYDPPVSLDTTPVVEPETVSLQTDGPPEVSVPGNVAANRASRAHYGLNTFIPKTWDEYYQPIRAGEENLLRTEVASQLDFQKNIRLQQTITGIANNVSGPLTPAEYSMIQEKITGNKPINPLTVFEDNFANKYVNSIYENNNPDSGSWINDARSWIPKQVSETNIKATRVQSLVETLRKEAEDMESFYGKQNWMPWTFDQIRNFFQIYVEAMQRNNVPGAEFRWMLGETLDAQATRLLESPDAATLKATIAPVMAMFRKYNPSLGVSWINAMMGQSMSERTLNNIFTVLTVPDYYGIAKTGFKIATGTRGIIARQIDLYNQHQLATRDIIAQSANLENRPINVVAPTASGNLEAAAVNTVTADVQAAIRGNLNPDQQARQQLTSNFRVMMQDIRENPARFGQTVATNLLDYIERSQNILTQVIDNVIRVNRIPDALASETVLSRVWNDIKGNWRGVDNAILDIDRPNLRYHQDTNTYHYDFKLGNSDGSFFESKEQALNNAAANGLLIRTDELGLNRTNLARKYSSFTEYRQDMRKQGIPRSKQEFKNSVEFLEATNAPVNAEGYSLGTATRVNRGSWIVQKYKTFTEYRKDMRTQGIKSADLQVKNSMEFEALKAKHAGATVEQSGVGYYINYTLPLKETDDIIRDGLLATSHSTLPELGLTKSILAYIRSPEDILSRTENIERKVATHAPSVFIRAAQEIIAKPISQLGWRHKKDFNRMLTFLQHAPGDDGIPGRAFKTQGEIEDWFQSTLKKPAPEPVVKAYWAFKGQAEFDAVLRDIEEYKLRSRNQVQSHNITIYAKGSTEAKTSTGFLDGYFVNHVPGGDGETVLAMGLNEGNEKFYNSNELNIRPKLKERWEKGLEEGKLKIIRLWNNEERPLQGFGKVTDQKVSYVVVPTSSLETKPMSYLKVARRDGGHLVPDYEHYISQAKVMREQIGSKIRHWYEGDTNVMPMAFKRMGEDVAKHMNEVRTLLRDGKIDEAKAYNAKYLPFKWEEHSSWYKPSKDPKGRTISPRLGLDEPITVRPSNTKLIDMEGNGIRDRHNTYKAPDGTVHENTFHDGTRKGNPARVNQVEFSQPRDHYSLYTITNKGSAKNPLYAYQPAEYIDAITIMNRSLNRIINTTFMSDMKIHAVEHWLQNAIARDVLDASPSEIRSNPYWHFNKGPEIYKRSVTQETKNVFNAAHRMIKDFTGQPNAVSTALHNARQKMVDSIYGKSSKWALIADERLPEARDPLATSRTFTYHLKLGLFSIPQFFMQVTTFSNIMALSPRHAPAAAYATLMHSWASVNSHLPFLKHLDAQGAHFGWRPGEFLEALTELRKTGFINIGVEHALLDTPLNTNIVKSGTQKVLSWGEQPFKKGAEFVRASAYYTAYREFRRGGDNMIYGRGWQGTDRALTDADRKLILSRAALLDHNQSRASSSALHTGAMASLGQFLAYNLRLTEMMAGKRLTGWEKGRLFAISSVLYGLPAGGMGLYLFPGEEYLRQKLHENGYVPGDNKMMEFLAEGLPEVILAAITGRHVDISGWGIKGEVPGTALFNSDKSWFEVFGGASLGTLASLLKQSDPFIAHVGAFLEGKAYPIKQEDWVDLLREARIANSIFTGYIAATAGTWLNKNREVVKGDMGPLESVLLSLTGRHPIDVSDDFAVRKSIADRDKAHKFLEKRFVKDYQAFLRAAAPEDGGVPDLDAADTFATRALTTMQAIPTEDQAKLYQKAIKGLEPSVERVPRDYWLKHMNVEDASWFKKALQGKFTTPDPYEVLDARQKNLQPRIQVP